MKKLYFLLFAFFINLSLFAQEYNPNNSHALIGSCLNPDEGTLNLTMDLNQNCPEGDPNGVLPGTAELGFHSGINHWASSTPWDSENAAVWVNGGDDIFDLTIDVEEYWGVPFGDVENIRIVGNNGYADPNDPWTIIVKDSFNAVLFGNLDDCSDLILHFDQTPTCADLNQASSLALFSDAGDSETCVDAEDGLVKIDIDYALACPEGDPEMVLAGASELALHSGANDWASVVAWDDPNAVRVVNDGNDNFSTIIDVESYYGIPYADVTNIQVTANNGLSNPSEPWEESIKDPRDGGFGGTDPCSDLIVVLSEAPACDLTSSTQDLQLQHSFKVSPNPFKNRTFLDFNNPNNDTFTLFISDLTGQRVRTMTGISGERVLIERDGLPTGMYMVNLVDEQGRFGTTKLMVK